VDEWVLLTATTAPRPIADLYPPATGELATLGTILFGILVSMPQWYKFYLWLKKIGSGGLSWVKRKEKVKSSESEKV
jgi:hypothetical protein